MNKSYDAWRGVLSSERLPTVVVDLDAFDRNARKLAGYVRGSGKKIRLATKSLRVPALIRRAIQADHQIYQGLMCYSAEEAEFLVTQGFNDFLVAYPTVQPRDLHILRELHRRGIQVSMVIDSIEGMRRVAEVMGGLDRPFPLVIDIDASLRLLGSLIHLGVRRSPVRTERDLAALLAENYRHPEIEVIGAMAYEAQVAGLGDRNPFKRLINPFAHWIRRISMSRLAKSRDQVTQTFSAHGTKLYLFNGGGTGSANLTVQEPWLTEISAGSGLLCSHLFDYYSNVAFEPACFFVLQASRVPAPGMVTCLGGGYVASGEPGWDKVPLPYLPEGTKLVSMEGCGEVQTPLVLPAGARVELGDPVFFRHAKAGELAERFNEYLLVSGGKVVERAKTYRGLGQCYF